MLRPKSYFIKPKKTRDSSRLFSLNVNPSFKLKQKMPKVSKKDMTWTQAKQKYIHLSPFGDADHDGVKNWLDCRPFDPKRHYVAPKENIEKYVKYKLQQTPGRVKNKQKYLNRRAGVIGELRTLKEAKRANKIYAPPTAKGLQYLDDTSVKMSHKERYLQHRVPQNIKNNAIRSKRAEAIGELRMIQEAKQVRRTPTSNEVLMILPEELELQRNKSLKRQSDLLKSSLLSDTKKSQERKRQDFERLRLSQEQDIPKEIQRIQKEGYKGQRLQKQLRKDAPYSGAAYIYGRDKDIIEKTDDYISDKFRKADKYLEDYKQHASKPLFKEEKVESTTFKDTINDNPIIPNEYESGTKEIFKEVGIDTESEDVFKDLGIEKIDEKE